MDFTASEIMTVTAARRLRDGCVCFVGIGLPSTAANLARRTHAPDLVLIYESGTIGAKPTVLPLSIGDGELATTADLVVSTPEIFAYWLQGGRVDTGFLGAAQIDRYANINTTVIGGYAKPRVRLPGAGGAPEIAAHAREVLIVMEHSRRGLVERLDFVTSAGHRPGLARGTPSLPGGGPRAVITDLAVLEPEAGTGELVVKSLHPGVTEAAVRDATGWAVRFAADVSATPIPTAAELDVLRELKSRRP